MMLMAMFRPWEISDGADTGEVSTHTEDSCDASDVVLTDETAFAEPGLGDESCSSNSIERGIENVDSIAVASPQDAENSPPKCCTDKLLPHVKSFQDCTRKTQGTRTASGESTTVVKTDISKQNELLLKVLFGADGQLVCHEPCVLHVFPISKGRLRRLQERACGVRESHHGLVGRQSNNSKKPETKHQFVEFVRAYLASGNIREQSFAAGQKGNGQRIDALCAYFNRSQRQHGEHRETISRGTTQTWLRAYFSGRLNLNDSSSSNTNHADKNTNMAAAAISSNSTAALSAHVSPSVMSLVRAVTISHIPSTVSHSPDAKPVTVPPMGRVESTATQSSGLGYSDNSIPKMASASSQSLLNSGSAELQASHASFASKLAEFYRHPVPRSPAATTAMPTTPRRAVHAPGGSNAADAGAAQVMSPPRDRQLTAGPRGSAASCASDTGYNSEPTVSPRAAPSRGLHGPDSGPSRLEAPHSENSMMHAHYSDNLWDHSGSPRPPLPRRVISTSPTRRRRNTHADAASHHPMPPHHQQWHQQPRALPGNGGAGSPPSMMISTPLSSTASLTSPVSLHHLARATAAAAGGGASSRYDGALISSPSLPMLRGLESERRLPEDAPANGYHREAAQSWRGSSPPTYASSYRPPGRYNVHEVRSAHSMDAMDKWSPRARGAAAAGAQAEEKAVRSPGPYRSLRSVPSFRFDPYYYSPREAGTSEHERQHAATL